jgi:hypothetical protein
MEKIIEGNGAVRGALNDRWRVSRTLEATDDVMWDAIVNTKLIDKDASRQASPLNKNLNKNLSIPNDTSKQRRPQYTLVPWWTGREPSSRRRIPKIALGVSSFMKLLTMLVRDLATEMRFTIEASSTL